MRMGASLSQDEMMLLHKPDFQLYPRCHRLWTLRMKHQVMALDSILHGLFGEARTYYLGIVFLHHRWRSFQLFCPSLAVKVGSSVIPQEAQHILGFIRERFLGTVGEHYD